MSFESLAHWDNAYSEDGTLCISYGKDSLACIRAIQILGWRLKRIVHAEVWATETIPADLPPMVKFKEEADKKIKSLCGIDVERIRANTTYEEKFYTKYTTGDKAGKIWGFPFLNGPWCNSRLKMQAIIDAKVCGLQYIGIACDEPNRFKVLTP